jgi:transposase
LKKKDNFMAFRILSDVEWVFIKAILPESLFKPQRGYPRADYRKVFNTIFYILDNGCKWVDAPTGKDFAARSTAHGWLKRWAEDGTWAKVQDAMLGAVSLQKKMQSPTR